MNTVIRRRETMMIRDYSKYELSGREMLTFYLGGYAAIFTLSFIFYRILLLSLALGFLVIRLRPFYEEYLAEKRLIRLQEEFKDMLYSLSSSISSGRHMSEAIMEARENLSLSISDNSQILAELAHMDKALKENNESDKVLLADFAERSHCEDIRNFVQVYTTCRSMGGDLERVIARSCDIITDKMNIRREIRAITAQKKLEGRLIALMPPVMLALLNLLSPSYIEPLYTTAGGRIVMTGALAAMFFGVRLMERISNVEI